MAELTTFNPGSPVIEKKQIASAAPGYEAFAASMDNLAKKSAVTAEKIFTEHSKAELLHASNEVTKLKNNSTLEIIKNPANSAEILANTATDLEKIQKSAVLNNSDRINLNAFSETNVNSLAFTAGKTQIDFDRKKLSIAFWDEYENSMNTIHETLKNGDIKNAEAFIGTFYDTAGNAFRSGVINRTQFDNAVKSIHIIQDNIGNITNNIGRENLSANHYHHMAKPPFSNGPNHENVGYPVNENSNWLTNHIVSDNTFRAQETNLYQGNPINWGVIANSTPEQVNSFIQMKSGHDSIMSAIESHVHFQEIDNAMKELDSFGGKLTPFQEAQRSTWNIYKKRMSNGEGFNESIANTSLGGKVAQEYALTSSALNSKMEDANSRYESAINQGDNRTALLVQSEINDLNVQTKNNYNEYLGKKIAIAHGSGISPEFIQPMDGHMVSVARDGMMLGQDVSPLIGSLGFIDKKYSSYLAQQSFPDDKDANKRIAVWASGLGNGNVDTIFQKNLLESNQSGINFDAIIKHPDNGIKNTRESIWATISNSSDFSPINEYFSQLPDSVNELNGLKIASTNYVYYSAIRNNDVEVASSNDYQKDYVSNMAKTFDIKKGSSYIFNTSSLPEMRDSDRETLSAFALSQTYKRIAESMTEVELLAYKDMNPLHVTNTPDGRIVVLDKFNRVPVDENGREYFDMPYTSDMLSHAYLDNDTSKRLNKEQLNEIISNVQRRRRNAD